MIFTICRRSFPEGSGDFPMQKGFSDVEKLEKKRGREAPVKLIAVKSAKKSKFWIKR